MWKQPRCPSAVEWVKKVWYIPTMGYYSALKKEILPYATTWMNLEDVMLNEISQTQKNKYCMIPHILYVYEEPKIVKWIETESRTVVARGWGGEWEVAVQWV